MLARPARPPAAPPTPSWPRPSAGPPQPPSGRTHRAQQLRAHLHVTPALLAPTVPRGGLRRSPEHLGPGAHGPSWIREQALAQLPADGRAGRFTARRPAGPASSTPRSAPSSRPSGPDRCTSSRRLRHAPMTSGAGQLTGDLEPHDPARRGITPGLATDRAVASLIGPTRSPAPAWNWPRTSHRGRRAPHPPRDNDKIRATARTSRQNRLTAADHYLGVGRAAALTARRPRPLARRRADRAATPRPRQPVRPPARLPLALPDHRLRV